MMQNIDFASASSTAIIAALGRRIEAIRLGRNISQQELAREAGVSRSTMTRLADGQAISLDSFVRVLQALGLADHLAALLPDPSVRPVERARRKGSERRRASRKRQKSSAWKWANEDEDA